MDDILKHGGLDVFLETVLGHGLLDSRRTLDFLKHFDQEASLLFVGLESPYHKTQKPFLVSCTDLDGFFLDLSSETFNPSLANRHIKAGPECDSGNPVSGVHVAKVDEEGAGY